MKLAESTEKGYRYYLDRYQADGCPEPEAWLDGLPSPGSAKVARSALRWAYGLDLAPRIQPYRVPRALTVAELTRVRNACNGMERDTVDALYYTGARISELLRMQPEDIHDGVILIRQTKGRIGERAVPLHPQFPVHLLPHPFGRDWAEKHLRTVGKKLGIRLHPHLLRSTFATHLLCSGVDVRTVQVLLGHSSIEMTMRYLATTEDRMRSAVMALG